MQDTFRPIPAAQLPGDDYTATPYHYVLHQLWAMFGTWLTHVHFMNMVIILGY